MILNIALTVCVLSAVLSVIRIKTGPTPADRVVAADLLTFSVVGMLAIIGTRIARIGTFDLIVVATLVAFLSAVALARVLTGGDR